VRLDDESVVVRRGEMTDLSEVETVARATWRVAYTGIIPEEVQRRLLDSWYSPDSLSRALAAPRCSFFVAESSGAVIGFAQFVRGSEQSVELTRLYVLPDRQRSGVGRRLLDAGLAEFAGEGLKHLTVQVERGHSEREVMGAARLVEPRPPVARPGQARRGRAAAERYPRLVHGGL
jgi:ribosomal protein S18 acetylase RimI-like enzyme